MAGVRTASTTTSRRRFSDTPLSSRLPVEVLTRLPEWSPLIVAPEFEEWPREIAGAFVCHSWNAIKERRELRVIYIPNAPDTLLISIIPLNCSTLAEALEAWRIETVEDAPEDGADVEATEELLARSRQAVSRVIGLVLYLCAENAELRALDDPGRPIRQTSAAPVAQRPREILVGYRTGPLLARRRTGTTASGTGRGVEPHLRRAHWHHYWVGAAEESERHLELRWLNPTLVGGRPIRPRVRDVGTALGD